MEENFFKLYTVELNCIQQALFLSRPPTRSCFHSVTKVNENFVKLYLPLSLFPLDKSADDTKPRRLVDTPDSYVTIHRLEIWAHRNLLKSDKRKCKVLHLKRNNPMHQDVLGANGLESVLSPCRDLTLQKELHLLSLYEGFNETSTTKKENI